MSEFPNDLFANGRRVLGRYGYRDGGAAPNWPAEWARLAPDFPFTVPAWKKLSAEQRAAAVDYMSRREAADRRLEACEALHARLLAFGIDTGLVEDYADARAAYEDGVEAFGAARERLQAALYGPSGEGLSRGRLCDS